jgi:hypothetical protein
MTDRSRRCQSHSKVMISLAASLLAGLMLGPLPAHAFQLITAEEAALPAGKIPVLEEVRRSPTRQPIILVIRPSPEAGLVHSPLELKLEFHAFGGAGINCDSIVVTYLKDPAIDLTQRLMPFITPAGIDIQEAEVPPGLHQFWIQVKDNDGRISHREFHFQVVK